MAYLRSLSVKTWAKLVALLLLLNVAVLASNFYNFNHPYWNVKLISAIKDGDYLYLTYTFTKGNCTRKRFSISAYQDGIGAFLTWEGLDGVPEDYDREVGSQTLRGRVHLKGLDPDEILIRTMHDCEGDDEPPYTQKVFDRLEAKDIQERTGPSASSVLGLRGP